MDVPQIIELLKRQGIENKKILKIMSKKPPDRINRIYRMES